MIIIFIIVLFVIPTTIVLGFILSIHVSIVLSIVAVAWSIIYFYVKHKHNYWHKRNVPFIKPTFLLGNHSRQLLQREFVGETLQTLCKQFPNEPYIGAFIGVKPVLVIQSAEMIKLITTKEFPSFSSRQAMDYIYKEPSGCGFAFAYGDVWKSARSNLTPMFSTYKLKHMMHSMEKCSIELQKYIHMEIKEEAVDVRSLMKKFTSSCFVSCAFGIDISNYEKHNEFLQMSELFFEITPIRDIFLKIRFLMPGLFYGLGLQTISPELERFFKKLLTEIFASRNYTPSPRNDFIDGLLHLKMNNADNKTVDDNYIVAQCISLFIGGFESTAAAMAAALYEIAKNQHIQRKLQEEIDMYLKTTDGVIAFDCINLPFLEACMNETIRMYPLSGIYPREAVEDFTLPSGLVLEKGLLIHIPVFHLHRSSEIFSNPDMFRPERFYGDTKEDIKPYTYLPFGEGPKSCIGPRFARMTFCSGLISILRHHNVILDEGMPSKLEFEPKAIFTKSRNEIRLVFKDRC